MPDCGICAELANRWIKPSQIALADRDDQNVAALDLELEKAIAHKSAAFKAWLDHLKSHGT